MDPASLPASKSTFVEDGVGGRGLLGDSVRKICLSAPLVKFSVRGLVTRGGSCVPEDMCVCAEGSWKPFSRMFSEPQGPGQPQHGL